VRVDLAPFLAGHLADDATSGSAYLTIGPSYGNGCRWADGQVRRTGGRIIGKVTRKEGRKVDAHFSGITASCRTLQAALSFLVQKDESALALASEHLRGTFEESLDILLSLHDEIETVDFARIREAFLDMWHQPGSTKVKAPSRTMW